MKYYDISPEISEKTAVFPGDHPYSRKVIVNFDQGCRFLLSHISTTVHLGAHADAPNHYRPGAQGIAACDLSRYMGRCQVIEVSLPRSERIRVEHLRGIPIEAKRILFKTRSFPNPEKWSDDFNSLSGGLVRSLASQGVVLIGIDTPSIDPAQDKDLESHNAIAETQVANLEGLVLDQVPPGVYTLLALPLKLKDADASPVRAILLEDFSALGS